jgi:hypothetical protein
MEELVLSLLSPTFAAAIVASIVSYLISRRSIYINSVTVERSKWIGELRANLASLSGDVLSLNQILLDAHRSNKNYDSSSEFFLRSQEIHRLVSIIKLQINPLNEIDKNILVILDDFEQSFQNPTDFSWVGSDYLLIAHAQYLLKSEWEKVKWEAAGLLRKPWLLVRRINHMRQYRKFVEREGPRRRTC